MDDDNSFNVRPKKDVERLVPRELVFVIDEPTELLSNEERLLVEVGIIGCPAPKIFPEKLDWLIDGTDELDIEDVTLEGVFPVFNPAGSNPIPPPIGLLTSPIFLSLIEILLTTTSRRLLGPSIPSKALSC